MEKIIITSGTLEDAKKALQLCLSDSIDILSTNLHPAERLFCTIGCHPTQTLQWDALGPEGAALHLSEMVSFYHQHSSLHKIVAVGEFGLGTSRGNNLI